MSKTYFSLREAADQVGKDKMTISRAISKGKLSAVKEDNQWKIEPSELFRVFDPAPKAEEGAETVDKEPRRQTAPSQNGVETERLRLQLEMKDETIQRLESERSRERQQFQDRIDDLAKRLDKADEARVRLTAVLTDQRTREDKDRERAEQEAREREEAEKSKKKRGLFGWGKR